MRSHGIIVFNRQWTNMAREQNLSFISIDRLMYRLRIRFILDHSIYFIICASFFKQNRHENKLYRHLHVLTGITVLTLDGRWVSICSLNSFVVDIIMLQTAHLMPVSERCDLLQWMRSPVIIMYVFIYIYFRQLQTFHRRISFRTISDIAWKSLTQSKLYQY